MAVINLQRFASVQKVGIDARLFSSFEIEVVRKEAHEAGIRDGAAAASEAFSSEQSRCLSRIHEAIGDTYFAREEAHLLALSSLRPLIESLAKAIAPALCLNGLAAEIAKLVDDAARRAPEDILTIFVPAGMKPEILKLFEHTRPNVQVAEDKSLASSSARVDWGGGFELIDLGWSSKAALTAIDEFYDEVDNSVGMRAKNAN